MWSFLPSTRCTPTCWATTVTPSWRARATPAPATIAQLEGYIARGYDLILTSHYTPEDWKDARTKIDYLKELKSLAAASGTRDSFLAAMKEKYPQYSGENYLSMTADFFFA